MFFIIIDQIYQDFGRMMIELEVKNPVKK